MKTQTPLLTLAAVALAGAALAQTPRGAAVGVIGGKTVTIDYGRSHEGIYILVGVLLVVAIAVGARLFFFLRRHKREA